MNQLKLCSKSNKIIAQNGFPSKCRIVKRLLYIKSRDYFSKKLVKYPNVRENSIETLLSD